MGDIEGAKTAMRRAIDMAQPGDKIIALHVPRLVPEMLLSSMSDPGDADEETLDLLCSLPSKAGENLQKQIKDVADEEKKTHGKDVDISYQVSQAAVDMKTAVLDACTAAEANMLVLGPGVRGNGSFPVFAVQNAKGFSVCVVRDLIE